MSDKIFWPRFATVYNKPKCNAKEFIETCVNGDDQERGSLESARAQADNVSEAFGRMVEILFDKKILSKEDVLTVGLGYVPENDNDW